MTIANNQAGQAKRRRGWREEAQTLTEIGATYTDTKSDTLTLPVIRAASHEAAPCRAAGW